MSRERLDGRQKADCGQRGHSLLLLLFPPGLACLAISGPPRRGNLECVRQMAWPRLD